MTPGPVALPEVATSSLWCQRWRAGRHSWRHVHEGGFDARRYRVEPISDTVARTWVVANHYSVSYPVASRRYGLFGGEQLVGACVLGVPMSDRVLTNVFPDLQPVRDSLELSRLVLDDAVPGNGESWFLARVFETESERGLRGVVAFADPVPRLVGGRVLFAGHTGHIYIASNAVYLGRSTARTMTVLPNGSILSARSAQKVRPASVAIDTSSGSLSVWAPTRVDRTVTRPPGWPTRSMRSARPESDTGATTATRSDSAGRRG